MNIRFYIFCFLCLLITPIQNSTNLAIFSLHVAGAGSIMGSINFHVTVTESINFFDVIDSLAVQFV